MKNIFVLALLSLSISAFAISVKVEGSIGAWAGMKIWHHKTMHKKFKYGLPAILIIQIILAILIITISYQTAV